MTTETKELTVLERVQNGVTQKHSFDGRSREGKTVRRLHNIAGYTATDVFYQVTDNDAYARTTWYTQLSLTGTQPQTLVDEYVHLSGEVVYLSSEVIVEVVSDKALYFAGHKVELVDGEIVRTPYEVVAPSWYGSLENAELEKYRWVNSQWADGEQLTLLARLLTSRKENIENHKQLLKKKLVALDEFNNSLSYFEREVASVVKKSTSEQPTFEDPRLLFDNAVKHGVQLCVNYMSEYLHKTTVDAHEPRAFRSYERTDDVRVYTATEAYAFTVYHFLSTWEPVIPEQIKLKVLEQFSKKVLD
jgi:hypothetical protein